jgi:hypothetical protein
MATFETIIYFLALEHLDFMVVEPSMGVAYIKICLTKNILFDIFYKYQYYEFNCISVSANNSNSRQIHFHDRFQELNVLRSRM